MARLPGNFMVNPRAALTYQMIGYYVDPDRLGEPVVVVPSEPAICAKAFYVFPVDILYPNVGGGITRERSTAMFYK